MEMVLKCIFDTNVAHIQDFMAVKYKIEISIIWDVDNNRIRQDIPKKYSVRKMNHFGIP